MTADDVAFTYQLGLSEACRGLFVCVNGDEGRLAAATAIDERTVEFRLAGPDPAFITVVLSAVLIEPRARVERAFAAFAESARGADPSSLRAAASRLEGALHPAEEAGCEAPGEAMLVVAEQAIAAIGRELRSRGAYAISPDACDYGRYLVRSLKDNAADALRLTGVDAVAAAYRISTSRPRRSAAARGESRRSSPASTCGSRPSTISLAAPLPSSTGRGHAPRLDCRGGRRGPDRGIGNWFVEPFASGGCRRRQHR